ncbi:MAG TPA: twin-arginine translocase subunit TatC [Dehalococcoidia bacterium]|nr:twin-arginine translocase subunit TatC [Dehalococcoidia bacterium]
MNHRELSLDDHLQELRRRLLISVIALLVGTVVAFAFWEQAVELLKRPAQEINGGQGVKLIATQVTETLTTSFKLSMVGGAVLAFPVILYQVIRFVAPGLTGSERRTLFIFMPGVMLAFVAGVAFGYFVLTPQALPFLLTFGEGVVEPLVRISSLVDVMIRLLFWMGIVFETPLVMLLLAQLGIVDARAFSRFRRFWVVIAFILSAVITPTFDPINQILVAVPLLVLYELGVLLARLAGRSRRKSAEATNPIP